MASTIRKLSAVLLLAVTIPGCSDNGASEDGSPAAIPTNSTTNVAGDAEGDDRPLPPVTPVPATNDWSVDVSPRAARLTYTEETGEPIAILTCAGGGRLIVRLPGVADVDRDEPLTMGAGDMAAVLAADPVADRAGVAGRGDIPGMLWAMLGQGLALGHASYTSGVLPPVPEDRLARFESACAR